MRANPIKEFDGTKIVKAGACGLTSLVLVGDGTNAAIVELHDHATAASGDVVLKLGVTTEQRTAVYCPSVSDRYANGIVAKVTGVGATAYASYEV
jgi:hypothetical protein